MKTLFTILALLLALPAYADVQIAGSCFVPLSADFFLNDCAGTGGCDQLGYSNAHDCEWNGVNDGGEADVDESDTLDPRATVVHGCFSGTMSAAVSVSDPAAGHALSLYSEQWCEFPQVPSWNYGIVHAGSGDLHWVKVYVDDFGDFPAHPLTLLYSWQSDTGGELPMWTAVDDRPVYVMQVLVQGNSTPGSTAEASTTTTLWRASTPPGGGCGIGPELLAALLLLRARLAAKEK